MKNENTTDAMCVCGHTSETHSDIKQRRECLIWDCECRSFTSASDATNAVCVDCGHTDHTKYDDGLRGICMNSECDCTSFTPATNNAMCICGHTIVLHFNVMDLSICSLCSCESFTPATSSATKLTVKQKLQAEIRELKLERDSLKRKVEAAKDANRYALATFRALDQYTFQDSDHGLLISEAVKKLEDDPLKEMEGLPS